jgi:hypothetical protein
VAARDTSPPGPLWSLTIRNAAGASTRVHGFDANGDGLADLLLEASVLFGAPGASGLAARFTPVPYAKLDGTSGTPAPTPMRTIDVSLMIPAGDVDGDGFDDAVLGDRLVGGAGGRPRARSTLARVPAGGVWGARGRLVRAASRAGRERRRRALSIAAGRDPHFGLEYARVDGRGARRAHALRYAVSRRRRAARRRPALSGRRGRSVHGLRSARRRP